MNNFNATGNIGRDAVFRAFTNGGGVASFSLAVSSGYGERESTLWVRCNIFGKRAESGLIQYLVKGQQVAVSGELSENSYKAQDGTDRKSLDLNVNSVDLIGGKKEPKPASPSSGQDYGANQGDDYLDSSIPF